MTDILAKHAPEFVALCADSGFAPEPAIVAAITKALERAWRDGHAAAAREYENEDLEPGETPCPIDSDTARGLVPLPLAAEALERARVVAVLDGWADARTAAFEDCYSWQSIPQCGQALASVALKIQGQLYRGFEGPTPDAARKAAARAIERGGV